MKDLLLGIDLGTSSVKAAAVDLAGSTIQRASVKYPINEPHMGFAEQDPEYWYQCTLKAVRRITSTLPAGQFRIAAVGLSGQMHGTLLLDNRRRLLAPAIIWPDQRSQIQAQEITELIGFKDLIQISGSAIYPGFQAASIRWLQQNDPRLWSRVRTILTPKDWLRWRLTGELASDTSDGSGTLLFDINKGSWSSYILEALDIDPDLLPPLQDSMEIAGYIRKNVCEELALDSTLPVVIGAADTACSLLAAGIQGEDQLLITIGSGGQVAVPIKRLILDQTGLVHTFCGAVDKGGPSWYLLAALLSAGLCLRWLRDNLLNLNRTLSYREMTELASASPPGARGLIFLPYLLGERTPHQDAAAKGAFIGLTSSHGQADLIRAVLEGVTMACFAAFSHLTELGPRPATIIIAGGGSQSLQWQQIFADIFCMPVNQLLQQEQSAVGAAMLAGAGAGLIDLNDSISLWPRYAQPTIPNVANRDTYQRLYTIFNGVYRNRLLTNHPLA